MGEHLELWTAPATLYHPDWFDVHNHGKPICSYRRDFDFYMLIYDRYAEITGEKFWGHNDPCPLPKELLPDIIKYLEDRAGPEDDEPLASLKSIPDDQVLYCLYM